MRRWLSCGRLRSWAADAGKRWTLQAFSALGVWGTLAAVALAQDSPKPEDESRSGIWFMAYALTILVVIFGLALVLRSTNRRERVEDVVEED